MKNCNVKILKDYLDGNSNNPLFDSLEVTLGAGTLNMMTNLPVGTVVRCDNNVDTILYGSIVVNSFPYTIPYDTDYETWTSTLTRETKFIFEGALYTNGRFNNFGNVTTTLNSVSLNSMLEFGALNNIYGYSPLYMSDGILSFDLGKIPQSKNFNRFFIFSGSEILISGNINVFSRMTSIIEIGLYTQPGVSGSLESLVEGLCTNGKESGTIIIDLRGTKCTFNNGEINNNNFTNGGKLVFSSTGSTVLKSNDTLLATYTKSNNTWIYE